MHTTRTILGGLAAATLLLGAAGCGDDDGGGEGDVEAYCRLSAERSESVDLPTANDFAEFRAAAPAEIRDDVETVIDAFNEIDDPEDLDAFIAAFEEPEVAEAIENLEAFEAENCEASASE